jgi:hypothetical protein
VIRGDSWGSVYLGSNFSSALYNRQMDIRNVPLALENNSKIIISHRITPQKFMGKWA